MGGLGTQRVSPIMTQSCARLKLRSRGMRVFARFSKDIINLMIMVTSLPFKQIGQASGHVGSDTIDDWPLDN